MTGFHIRSKHGFYRVRSAGVPVVPGLDEIADVAEAKAFAAKIGYPVIVKASAGGGGRGIRIVEREEDFETAVALASNEALSAFGNGKVYLEKFLTDVKHVEMQIVADEQGNVVCLGERDCSMQRKNQKLIEESPCVVLKEDVRREMMRCAVLAAKAVNYTSLGTIEFLLDKNNDFYFMEMNTRLQVEHPVTEMVTNIDLVKWQIRIAAGLPMDFTQADIRLDSCAIECRINAENPDLNFRPSCGRISLLHIPGGPPGRLDTALYQDYQVPPFYDSMIGKLIVSASTRQEAIRKMQAALCELVIEGVDHNGELQMELLSDERFLDGSYTTDMLG